MNREFDCRLELFRRFVFAMAFLLVCLPYPAHTCARARPTTALLQKPDEIKGPAGTTIPAGEAFTPHSNILSEDRRVYVALPSSYSRRVQAYPVLYLTDAQFYFDQTRSTAAFLARERIIPEMIVVGVTDPDRVHDFYATKADFRLDGRIIPAPTSGNADHFLEFIASELIPWIENSYRTSGLRILAGVSAGGYFALHSTRMKPGLFQMLIVASPWLAWDDSKELKALLPFVSTPRFQVKGLFVSYASEGPEMKANVDTLVGALKSRNDPSFQLALRSYLDETHNTTVIKSYYDGLRTIFDDWAYPRDPLTNMLTGSLNDLKTHYHKLGERLGVALLPPEPIVNNTENYPRSANVWDSLGEALEKAGKLDEALASYQRAVVRAEANGDPNLENFRKNVIRLNELLKSKVK